jgi:hypothetical protein
MARQAHLDAEFENLDLLYSRLISDFWELQGGIGYQGGIASNDHPERYFGVVNLQGLVPYRFETDLDLRVSNGCQNSASARASTQFARGCDCVMKSPESSPPMSAVTGKSPMATRQIWHVPRRIPASSPG